MAVTALLLAALLPLAPQPALPFPKIVTDAPTLTDVAPGVQYGDYQMLTAGGPLSVHVVAVDLREPSLRIGTVLAQDRLISQGETISSMAARTGAVAGINGDYFDIDQTNQPLNILITNSRLVHAPSQRWALAVSQDKTVSFDQFSLGLTATLPAGTLDLKALNDWPPPGGAAAFITPEYGPLRAAQNVTEIALQPVDGSPPFATYRVASIADNTAAQPPGYYLAIGENSYGQVDPPNAGDTVTIADSATPSIANLVAAVGGGPLLVKNGAWYADAEGPSGGEFATPLPLSGAAITREGALLLFQVDGRRPGLSVGLMQTQLASLMIAFGAQTGMEFDGGGSSTLVARTPGDTDALVQNAPSDGVERRVADGLFVYSDAPEGPPARLYATPQEIRALPGARVPLRIAVTDYAVHPIGRCPCIQRMRVVPSDAGTIDGDTFVAGSHEANAVIQVQDGGLHAGVPVRVTTNVARVQILPEHPALLAGDRVALQARAFDARGYPIALPESLPWAAHDGTIDERGVFRAGASDGSVSVRIGDRIAGVTIAVGEHSQDLDFVRPAAFSTIPRERPGAVTKGDPCPECLTLQYDFTGDERAAYANVSIPIPQIALALSADVFGDGNGETLRVAVNNAIDERFLYTLAKVDWRGWKRVEVRFPPELPQPLTLRSLYVINRVGPEPAVTASGSIALRNVRVTLAGSANAAPK